AAIAGGFYDANPLFWVSIGLGLLVLVWCALHARQDFLAAWVILFFGAALAIFFAGAARYLLPIAAPAAILASRKLSRTWLAAGVILQLPVSLGLACVNYQHWDGYRKFAKSLAKECSEKRVWVNGEWGLRYYLEAEGALPLERDHAPRPGDLVVTSALSHFDIPGNAPRVALRQATIGATLPLRLIALGSRSTYSTTMSGLRPFDISTGPIDRLQVDLITERRPVLADLTIKSPEARQQIVSGVYPDGWTGQTAEVILKAPSGPTPLRAVFYISRQATARRVTLELNGATVADAAYKKPGLYTLVTAPLEVKDASATVTLRVDRTFIVPNDGRTLGVVLAEIGFEPLTEPRP
ncbi:MAG: hypothetical protein ABI165_13565, partial [Bryobacteraceae bacterium]